MQGWPLMQDACCYLCCCLCAPMTDLQQHLADLHVEGVLRQRTCPTCVDKQQRPSDQGEVPHATGTQDAPPHQHGSTGAPLTTHSVPTGNGTHAASGAGAGEPAAAQPAAAEPPSRHASDSGVAGGRHESPAGVIYHAFHHGHSAGAVATPAHAPAAASGAAAAGPAAGSKPEGGILKSILRQPGAKAKLSKVPVAFITEEQKRAQALYQVTPAAGWQWGAVRC